MRGFILAGAVSGLLWACIPLVILLLVVAWVIGTYNKFIRTKNSIEEAFATMDVYLKKRYDLIPNLVETVKGYAAHESATLEKVIQARNMAAGAVSHEDKIAGEGNLNAVLKSLFAVSESYPELKANTNFINLQNQLDSTEEDIANSRKYYNAVVKTFNNMCEMFPSSIIAGFCHFTRQPLFEVSSLAERENVQVKF